MIHSLQTLKNYRLEAVNFFVGGVVLAFELTASRIVAPYIGTTIYVWTSIIGVILGALAIGYTLGGYLADKRHQRQDVIQLLIISALLIIGIDLFKDWFLAAISGTTLSLQLQGLLGSLVLFAPPTIALGAISPYLVRLSLKNISTSGSRVARISAAGTLGSLTGTFLTGYFLFGFVGTRNILGGLALSLILISFLMETRTLRLERLLMIVAILGFAVIAPKPHIFGLVGDIDTKYSRVLVRDASIFGRPVRVLQTDQLTLQSGIYLDNHKDLVFPYAHAFAAAAGLKPHAKNFLVIGGGAYTFPSYLARTYPSAQIDTVEIDSGLLPISTKYFDFSPAPNLNIIHADGRTFLNTTKRKYDMVFVDAFSSKVPPFQVFTKEAVSKINGLLSDDGLVVVNILSSVNNSDAELALAVNTTYQHIFNNVRVFRDEPQLSLAAEQNFTLLAGKSTLPDQLSYSAGGRAETFSVLMSQPATGVVLTDDFAPIEKLSAGY